MDECNKNPTILFIVFIYYNTYTKYNIVFTISYKICIWKNIRSYLVLFIFLFSEILFAYTYVQQCNIITRPNNQAFNVVENIYYRNDPYIYKSAPITNIIRYLKIQVRSYNFKNKNANYTKKNCCNITMINSSYQSWKKQYIINTIR